MTKILIPKFDDINVTNDDGKTPFEIACIAGDLEMMKLLFKNGSRVIAVGENVSPLCLTIHNGHYFCTLWVIL